MVISLHILWTHSSICRSRVFIEHFWNWPFRRILKPIVVQLVKKYFTFYGTRILFTVLIRFRHWNQIQEYLLMMEASSISETLVSFYDTTRRKTKKTVFLMLANVRSWNFAHSFKCNSKIVSCYHLLSKVTSDISIQNYTPDEVKIYLNAFLANICLIYSVLLIYQRFIKMELWLFMLNPSF